MKSSWRRLRKRLTLLAIAVGLIAVPLLVTHRANAAVVNISTCTELQNMTSGTTWRLTADIDCSDTTTWNSGAGFAPIGGFGYAPDLDGQGHTISGLYINRPGSDNIGIFGFTQGGTITNVRLKDFNITGHNSVGTLGGELDGITITNVQAHGTVTGNQNVGGLLGYLGDSGTISKVITDGTVTANELAAGTIGVINTASGSTVSDVINTVALTANGGAQEASGIFAYSFFSTMSNLLNVGPVVTDMYVGGIGGFLNGGGTLSNAVAVGSITHGSNPHGGILAQLDGTASVTNSYWSTGDTGESSRIGLEFGTVTGGGSVASKSSYINTSSQAPLNSWNFSTIWQTAANSLPQLRGFNYLTISTTSLPSSEVDTSYSKAIVTTDPHGPVTYALASGTLPAGITLNTSSGLLSGTPTESGDFNITISARDLLLTTSKAYTLSITEPPAPPVDSGGGSTPPPASPGKTVTTHHTTSNSTTTDEDIAPPLEPAPDTTTPPPAESDSSPTTPTEQQPETQPVDNSTTVNPLFNWWWLLLVLAFVVMMIWLIVRRIRRQASM